MMCGTGSQVLNIVAIQFSSYFSYSLPGIMNKPHPACSQLEYASMGMLKSLIDECSNSRPLH